MWTTLALTAVLSAPAQATKLELTNVRTTNGVLGQERKDDKLLPGDVLVVAFDIEGLRVRDDGRVLYAMGMELTQKGKDKPEFKREPQDLEAYNSLGGSTLPAFALSILSMDSSPGQYTLKVTVKDRLAKTEAVLEKRFQVMPIRFGLVQVRFTSSNGDPMPGVAVPGQRLYLHCALVGFETDKKDKLPNVTFEMEILDESRKPTVSKPFKGDLKPDLKGANLMPFRPIPIELNRPGKFTVVLKAKDNVSGRTTTESLSLNVLSNK